MHDTRLATFEQYRETITEIPDHFDDPRFVIGTHAPRRNWGDMVHEHAQIDGLHSLRQLAEDPQADHDHTPHAYHDEPSLVAKHAGKWIGDVAYPRVGFADPDTTTDLESADRSLIATTFFDAEHVDTSSPHVLDVDEYADVADDVLEQYDPDDHAVFTGAFAPQDSYSFSVDGPFMRAADAVYPASAFTHSTGLSSLNAGKTSLYGSIVIPREHLSSDALDILSGELDEITATQDDEDDSEQVEA